MPRHDGVGRTGTRQSIELPRRVGEGIAASSMSVVREKAVMLSRQSRWTVAMRPALRSSLLLVAAGCLSQARGARFYDSNQPLRTDQVAMLDGYVESVDGVDVWSLARPFELLPGCHVVATPERWSRGSDRGVYVATTGHRVFALPMRPGCSYLVDLHLTPSMDLATLRTGGLSATETCAAGDRTRVFEPSGQPGDVDACKSCAADFTACDQ